MVDKLNSQIQQFLTDVWCYFPTLVMCVTHTQSYRHRAGTHTCTVREHRGCRTFSVACFNSSKMNDLYVECNFILLCLENKGWREWVTRSLQSLQSIQGKYIHRLYLTSTPPSHSSLRFVIFPFHSLCKSVFQRSPSLVCTQQHNRELWGPPHHKAHDEVTPKSAGWLHTFNKSTGWVWWT